MKCEVGYCIYNSGRACTVGGIEIDRLGMCNSCEIVTIPKKELEKYKKTRLKKIEELWREHDR
jgi:hypothetical protein